MDIQKLLPFVYEGTFTWTMTTNGYKFYTLNLVQWLKEVAKVPWNLCIICCDIESFLFFQREGVPCISIPSERSGQKTMAVFGSDEFAKWNRMKLQIFDFLVRFPGPIQEVLFLDGDIVVQKDPWPVLKEELSLKAGCSLAFQCDSSLSEAREGCECICSGVVYMRPGALASLPDGAEIFRIEPEEWIAAERQDQPYIRSRLQKFGVTYEILSRRQFGNGAWQKTGAWKDGDWTLLHYNYRMGDTKKAAMKTYGHWRIPY